MSFSQAETGLMNDELQRLNANLTTCQTATASKDSSAKHRQYLSPDLLNQILTDLKTNSQLNSELLIDYCAAMYNLSILLSEDAIEKFKQKKSNKQQQNQTIDDCVQMMQLALKPPRAASQSEYSQLYETQLRNFEQLQSKTFF